MPMRVRKGTLTYANQPAYNGGFELPLPAGPGPHGKMIEVVIRGTKTQLDGTSAGEAPLVFLPEIANDKIRVRIWDSSGNEYPNGIAWNMRQAQISYTIFYD